MGDENSTPLAAHLAAKIPPFWPQDPELFFVRVEAEFNKARPAITVEATKFSHLVGALDKETAGLVRNQLLHPDATEPYTKLKNELIRKFTLSDHACQTHARELLLGDKKPSALLCKLQQLLPSEKFSDAQVRDIFISKMPTHIQPILATMSTQSLETVATTADAVIDFGPCSTNNNSVNECSIPHDSVEHQGQRLSDMTSLQQEVNVLRRELQQFKQNSRPATSARSAQRCWYHLKFGKNAKKCVPPCKGN
jgi:hypothetical protein